MARGLAALRLAEFRDVWAGLTPIDRGWFAEDLRDLLARAIVPGLYRRTAGGIFAAWKACRETQWLLQRPGRSR